MLELRDPIGRTAGQSEDEAEVGVGIDGVGSAGPSSPMSAILLAVTAAAAGVFAGLFLSYRRRLYVVLGRDLGFPIPTAELRDFDARFAPGPFGVSLAAEVAILPELGKVIGGVNTREMWVLAVFARGARRLFEFGTATGRTTYLWARNSPADAVVGTLTLGPGETPASEPGKGDSLTATRTALDETRFTSFVYSGTDVEPKVRQYLGDSKRFDESEWVGRCDVVFVDGSHAFSYVQSDSEKAMRMVRPGGVVLWHDYRGPRICGDVYRYLNGLSASRSLVRLAGTRIVAWRAPL